jgi:hypothetical protein
MKRIEFLFELDDKSTAGLFVREKQKEIKSINLITNQGFY